MPTDSTIYRSNRLHEIYKTESLFAVKNNKKNFDLQQEHPESCKA